MSAKFPRGGGAGPFLARSLRTFGPSASVTGRRNPTYYECTYDKSVVHYGQLKQICLFSLNVDIHLNINQLNFRFYIVRMQNRNESVAPAPRLYQHEQGFQRIEAR